MAGKGDVARVSQRELASAVGKAVELASRKHKLRLEPNLFERDVFQVPWWIVGRVVRERADLDQAFKAAETITSGVKFPGVELQPVALKINADILVGFIERFGDRLEPPFFINGGGDF